MNHTPPNPYPQAGGFTLIETLIALTISAILFSQLAPGYDRLLQEMRLRGVTSTLERTLRLMRQESILRQMPTRICPSTDLESCTDDTGWSAGWIGYVDTSGGPGRDPDDPIILTQPATERVKLMYNRGNSISTGSHGRLSQNGTMRICTQDKSTENIELVMVRSGRLRVTRSTANCEA